MSLKFNFIEYLPYEITEEASKYFSLQRFLPSEGLTIHAMFNALKNMGYSPICFSKETTKRSDWKPIESIYKYVESRIPVIATVPDHAFVIIGHTFAPTRRIYNKISRIAKRSEIISSANWVDAFIIHDDALGPYRLLPVSNRDRSKLIQDGFGKFLSPSKWHYNTVNDIDSILVPLPEKVYILSEHMGDIVNNLLKDRAFLSKLKDIGKEEKVKPITREFIKSLHDKSNPIVTRSYISCSTDYKKSLITEPLSNEMSNTVIKEYEKLPMSRYIWVVEITNAKRFSKEEQKDRKIFGEIIIDATANKFGVSFLALHLPGMLFLHDTDKNDIKKIPIPDDREYRHPIRKIEEYK